MHARAQDSLSLPVWAAGHGEENASGRSAANNGTTDASWADRVSEAGNAVIANQRTIFICFLGAAVVAALVILIIQILTKYLIYRKVLEKFKQKT